MGWTQPRDWSTGEIVTESMMDEQVKNNIRYLKGLDGAPTIESGLIIDNTDGDERLLLPLLSTAECTTVLNAEGEMAFDEQTHRPKYYNGTAVGSVVSTIDVDDAPVDSATTDPISSNWAYDHVAAADPHPGYILESLLDAQGDLIVASANDTPGRLAIGANGTYLKSNGTTAAWAAGTNFSTQTDVSGSRATDATVYQNTGVTNMLVVVSVTVSGNTTAGTSIAYCDANAAPVQVVSQVYAASNDDLVTVTVGGVHSFIVLPNYYYKVNGGTEVEWIEWA